MMISAKPTPTPPVHPIFGLMVPNLCYALDFARLISVVIKNKFLAVIN